jgi:hypothetical protein
LVAESHALKSHNHTSRKRIAERQRHSAWIVVGLAHRIGIRVCLAFGVYVGLDRCSSTGAVPHSGAASGQRD